MASTAMSVIVAAIMGWTGFAGAAGPKPDENSPRYASAIRLGKSATVSVRAFKDGMDPSDVFSATHVLAE